MKNNLKVVSRVDLAQICSEERATGKVVVFTNGCFDILHVGHARYLEQAKELGDILVVGVNSDSSVKLLKGESRPIVSEDERAEMISHLGCVDYVCIFEESNPENLIRAVRPNIHTKGGDYRPEDLPEARIVSELGGRVVILPLVPGKSTTSLLKSLLPNG